MKNQKWIIAMASSIGRSHLDNSIPCQDAHLCQRVDESDWYICVVADGAGSHKFSDVGSRKVVELAILYFTILTKESHWIEDNILPKEKLWHDLVKTEFKKIFLALESFANEKKEYSLEDLSSTIIVTIATPIGLLVSHIGDGRAGYLTLQNEWKSMIIPSKGEYANETVFITSPIWKDEIIDLFVESRVIDEPIKAFAMMTDGCENICFETTIYDEEIGQYEHVNKPFPGFFNPIMQALINLFEQGKTEQQINLLWEDYLNDGTEDFALEQDDKTLILAINYDNVNA